MSDPTTTPPDDVLNWIDYARLAISVLVPFAAVWFATTRALRNAEKFYNRSQNDTAKTLEAAVAHEMLQNRMMMFRALRRLMHNQKQLNEHLEPLPISVEFDRTVYPEAVKYLARLGRNGAQLAEFYGTLNRFKGDLEATNGELDADKHKDAAVDIGLTGKVINTQFEQFVAQGSIDLDTEFADEVANDVFERFEELYELTDLVGAPRRLNIKLHKSALS